MRFYYYEIPKNQISGVLFLGIADFGSEDESVGNSQQHSNDVINPSDDGHGIRRKVNRQQYIDECHQCANTDIQFIFGRFLHGLDCQ